MSESYFFKDNFFGYDLRKWASCVHKIYESVYKDGINFEGPAPRPLERYAISIADDGQLEIDKSKSFQEELGQWNDPASYVTA